MSSPALSPTPRSPPVLRPDLAADHDPDPCQPSFSMPATPPPPATPCPLPTPPEPPSDCCPDPPLPAAVDPPLTTKPHVSRNSSSSRIRTLLAKAHAQTLKFATRAAARHLPGAIGLATAAGRRNGQYSRTDKALLEPGLEGETDDDDDGWPDPPSPPPPMSPMDGDEEEEEQNQEDRDQERKRALCLQLALLLAITQHHHQSQCTAPSPSPSATSSSSTPSSSTDEKLDQVLSMMSDLAYSVASLQQQILVMDARTQHSFSRPSSSFSSTTTARGRSLSPHRLMLSSSSAASPLPTPPTSRRTSVSTAINGPADPSHDALVAAKRAGKFLVPARRRLSNSSAASTSDRRDSTSSIDSALHSPALPAAWPAKKGRDSACYAEPGTTGTDTDTDGQSTASSAGIKTRPSRRRSTLASRLNMPTPLPEVAELSLSVASSAAGSLILPKSKDRTRVGEASTSASAVAHLIDRFQSMSPPSAASSPPPVGSNSSTPTPEKAARRSSGMVAQLIAAFSSSSSSSSSTSSSAGPSSATPSPVKQAPIPATPTRSLPAAADLKPATPPPAAFAHQQRGPPSVHSRTPSACSTLLGPIVEEDDDVAQDPSVKSSSTGAADDSFTRRSKVMSPTLIRMTQQLIDEEEMDVVRQHVDVFEPAWSASDDDEEEEEEADGWWYHGRGIESYFAPDYDRYDVDQDSMSVVSDPLGEITTMDDREVYVPLDETTLLLEEADAGDLEAIVGNGESFKESLVSPPLLPETPSPVTPKPPCASRPTSTCSSDGKLDESNRESYPWHVHPLDRESSCCNVHNLLKSQRVPVSPFASKFAPPPSASRRASASVVEGPMSPPMSPLVARMSERARRAGSNGGGRNSICVTMPTTPRSTASPQPVSGTSRRDALEALRTPRRQPVAPATPARVSTPVADTTPRRQSSMIHSHVVAAPPHTPSPAPRRPRSSLVTPPATLQQPMPVRPSRSSGGYVKSVAESLAAGMAIRTASPRSAGAHGHVGVHLAATPPSMASYHQYGRVAAATAGATSTSTSSGSSGSSRRSSITSYLSLRHLANVAVAPAPVAPRVVSQAPAPAPSSRAKPVIRAFRT